jgi:hypothetical protein
MEVRKSSAEPFSTRFIIAIVFSPFPVYKSLSALFDVFIIADSAKIVKLRVCCDYDECT